MNLNITMENFKDVVLKSNKPVLVKFYADSCGSCQILGKIMDGLDDELNERAVVAQVDIGQQKELANIFKIMSIPTLVVFNKGKIVNHHAGLLTKIEIINLLP